MAHRATRNFRSATLLLRRYVLRTTTVQWSGRGQTAWTMTACMPLGQLYCVYTLLSLLHIIDMHICNGDYPACIIPVKRSNPMLQKVIIAQQLA